MRFATNVERADDRTLVLRRVFPCSPATLFRAMTEPEVMKRWWAPTSLGVVLYSIEADVRATCSAGEARRRWRFAACTPWSSRACGSRTRSCSSRCPIRARA